MEIPQVKVKRTGEKLTIVDVTNEKKCCCSCKYNKRVGKIADIKCYCEIDGHYIGYVANFESVCGEWERGE